MAGKYAGEIRDVVAIISDAARIEILPRWGNVVEKIKGTSASGYKDTVTAADTGASEYILSRVREKFPGSYSEEHPFLDDENRWNAEYIWHFDPVDGTLEFCSKIEDGYALNASLLQRQKDGKYLPVAGAVYRPGDDTLVFNDGSDKNIFIRNGKIIELPQPSRKEVLGWVRKVDPSKQLEKFYETLGEKLGVPGRGVPRGGIGASIVDLLEGKINILAYNFNLTREWDWAMAVPIIRAAGGFICDCFGNEFDNFNRRQTPERKEYDLNGVVASIAFRKEEIIPNIPAEFVEDRLPTK